MKIPRMLSFVLIPILAILVASPAFADNGIIGATPYVSTSTSLRCANLTQGLHYGISDTTTNGEVSILQTFLHKNGYLSVNPTGYFGSLTFRGVKAFQAQYGMRADGIVGVQTRAHIFAKDCGDYTPPLVSAAPVISGITPAQGPVGTAVTLHGSGFTTDIIVHFSIGGISNGVIGNNGTTLTFTVPEYIGPFCKAGQMCPMYATQLTIPAVYSVSVENSAGTSNAVSFAITN